VIELNDGVNSGRGLTLKYAVGVTTDLAWNCMLLLLLES
jgi:hypothetical protein